MQRKREEANCTAVRLFLWNEKLTKNQISQSEGLCVCLIRSTYVKVSWSHDSTYGNIIGDRNSCTIIPFDLSKLLNKDASLSSMLVSATLQFLPETIKHLADNISNYLFTKFQYTQAFLQPPPRPTYVIALEISHVRFVNSPNPTELPPPVPSFCRFKKDWDEKKEIFVRATDYVKDPYHRYSNDVLEYLQVLRKYTGEGGTCPTKPRIAKDVARGFYEVKPTLRSWCPSLAIRLKDLIDDTCPVCYGEFEDENEVIVAYCSHAFHIRCLLPWLSKKNTCPTCRAVYPLHYSPLLDRQQHNHN